MIRLAGERADGMLGYCHSVQYVHVETEAVRKPAPAP
jgi:hypothetical protein